jgi:CxxC motif-containing protein (DUF1111 family)
MVLRRELIVAVVVMGGCAGAGDEEEQVSSACTSIVDAGLADMGAVPDALAPSDGTFIRPLPGLTPAQLALFNEGRTAFETAEDVADGLGPIFNGNACAQCHKQGGTGGGSNIFETRFGRLLGNTFDPLANLGGSLLQDFSIGSQGTPPGCFFPTEVVPPQANHTTLRRSLALFGDGLIDSVTEAELMLIAQLERLVTPTTAGRVSMAQNLATQVPVPSRFGWKAQVPNLFQFSGNAYVNEMGITNPQFPLENCPNQEPNCPLVQRCNPAPGLNDDGSDVQAFTNFMRFLAPPPRGPITLQVKLGEAVFVATGCANCHLPTLVTGPSDVAALSHKTFHPYSDLLLHDMGSLGDGISGQQMDASFVDGNATPREMRTQPLWGVRIVQRLLHDGRATTFAEAILAHTGQGQAARDRFARLRGPSREALLAFLGSL